MPGDDPLPGAIVPGPDGALYVAERNDNVISRMTTAGEFTDEYALPRENADPLSMVKGVDGALYISEFMGGVVSRMTFDGTFTKAYRIPGGFNDRVISAPDGALWVAQGSRGKVSRLDVGLDYPVTAQGTTFEARAGKTVNATVATFTDGDPNARAGRLRGAHQLGRRRPLVRHRPAARRRLVRRQGQARLREAGLPQGRRPHHGRRREGPRREGDELGDRPPLSRGHHAGTARRYSSYCAPYRSASVGSS